MSIELDKFYEACDGLPSFCFDFFAAKINMAIKTRIAYAQDYKVFFHYLLTQAPERFPYENITEIELRDLDKLDHTDINKYMLYLTEYTLAGVTYKNSAAGKKRKISALKTFFQYFRRIGLLKQNPTELIEMPKVSAKAIVKLSDKEQQALLEAADTGKYKKAAQMQYHEKTKYRDIAILMLFLGTGLRISELVGIDACDVDLLEQRILVTRKGGKQDFVYFNETVLNAILDYMDQERMKLLGVKEGDEDLEIYKVAPLFVSLHRRRISVRMVEIIVKNYAKDAIASDVKVSPHVLRKTFGTDLYNRCRDLYLVQKALGHASSDTTQRFYTDFNPEHLKILKSL